MGNNDYQQYKIAKTISEQIEYLNKNKRVQFNCMDKDKAKDKLLEYNYINIIHHLSTNLQNKMTRKKLKKLMAIMYMKEMLILMNIILCSKMKERAIQ